MKTSRKLELLSFLLAELAVHSSQAMPMVETSYESRWVPQSPNHASAYNATAGLGYQVAVTNLTSGDRVEHIFYGTPVNSTPAGYSIGEEIFAPEDYVEGASPILDFMGGPTNVVWLDYADMLLAVDMGAVQIGWLMEDGTTNQTTAVVAPDPSKRPVRLYWTEGQYAGPEVKFGSNYEVMLHYNSQIRSTNEVWIAENMLHAARNTSGRMLLTYSRIDELTGLRELIDYEIVEVLQPMSSVQKVNVGDRLRPLTRNFDTEELFSEVVRGAYDETGENPEDIFVYKHTEGIKNGWIWPIRETEQAWQIEIYWKAKEALDVIWPFEVDNYEVTWGDDLQAFVRGDLASDDLEPMVYIPSDLTVSVMPYQTEAGQSGACDAFAFVEDGKLYTDNVGKFLLRYSTDETIWFEAVEAVPHTWVDPQISEWSIASRIEPLVNRDLFADWPGYIYIPQGTAYNPNYYSYPTSYPNDLSNLKSSVFGVNEGRLEVWWANPSHFWTLEETDSNEVQLPAPLYFPSMVNWYENVWPTNADEIVTASGLGSNGRTLLTNDTAYLTVSGGFTAGSGSLGKWEDSEEFTLEAWVFPASSTGGTLFRKGSGDSAWSLNFGSDGSLQLKNGEEETDLAAALSPDEWTHVALSRRVDGSLALYLNGTKVTFLESMNGSFNFSGDLIVGSFSGALDEVRIWNKSWSDRELQLGMRHTVASDLQYLLYRASFDPDETEIDYNPANRVPGGQPKSRANLSLAGTEPAVYYQNDPEADGYNPNEEHALLFGESVFALRSDLNVTNETDEYTSDPFVLVEITDPDSCADMAIYKVVPENELYAFEQFYDAGMMFQAPAPLNQMVPSWMPQNRWLSEGLEPFTDRNGNFWAHQAGNGGGATNSVISLYYPNQIGFWNPDDVALGEPLPLKNVLNENRFTYTVVWPETAPGLYVGDTLTNSKDGLPAIRGQLSANVVYQQSLALENKGSVVLIDPTCARKVSMAEVPAAMKSYRDPVSSYTFFSELPPALRERMFWTETAPSDERFQLIGTYNERTDGHNYLLLNLLDGDNLANALDEELVKGQDDVWKNAIQALPSTVVTLTDDETPFDSLALSTVGKGSGYVTLIFNNSENEDMVDPSEKVTMTVIKVEPELYCGRLDPIFSPNPLDRKMTLKYTADFAGVPDRYAFEWQYADPQNGEAPDEDSANWKHFAATNGLHYTSIGDEGVFGLSDHYLRCRYKALDSEVVANVGSDWSSWTPPQLCEGWIKRAMKEINPYEQRIRDYMNYELDTSLSMIQQAGCPYSGDIPLNYDALDDYGLIPIYETIYRQSLELCRNEDVDGSLSMALMMVAGRLADFYTLLGNEAYADALNPLVSLGEDDLSSSATSVFCFQNQLPDLLSEELALLRGRDDSMNPAVTAWPVYNRLVWNFTSDITGGEVAYALNYGISDLKGDQNGSVDEADAAILYPQGHGDAWGHYLKTLKYYYAMLHAPNFHWYPQVEGLLVGDTEVTVSYLHEKKFVHAAVAKARCGTEILNKTRRQMFKAGEALSWSVLEDDNTERAWGVAEWASRAGQGAYFDWLAGNSLLPDVNSDPADEGIRVIDRETTPELAELAAYGYAIQQELDEAVSGMNPLGLVQDAISFDITPSEIDAGRTHFEQLYDRAVAALQNANAVFERVQDCTDALRDQNEDREFDSTLDDEEAELNRRLIEVYGYPYSDDIGPGKIYAQDYDGPDLIHYNYIEQYVDEDGGYDTATLLITNVVQEVTGYEKVPAELNISDWTWAASLLTAPELAAAQAFEVNSPVIEETEEFIEFAIGASGLPVKPESYTGFRRAEGRIQIALSEYVQSLNNLNTAAGDAADSTELARSYAEQIFMNNSYLSTSSKYNAAVSQIRQGLSYAADSIITSQEAAAEAARTLWDIQMAIADAGPTAVGLSNDAGAALRAAAAVTGSSMMMASSTMSTVQKVAVNVLEGVEAAMEVSQSIVTTELESARRQEEALYELKDLISENAVCIEALYAAAQAAETARMNYLSAIAEGDALQVERERLRMNHASDLNTKRYRNMAYQIFRNDELDRYSESFDLAARYCYLAAKAYDYETGMLGESNTLYEDIVKARAIGRMSSGSSISSRLPLAGGSDGGDPGLADILARLKANWDVYDSRLGFNNPESETGRFSLRSELFRIKPTEIGGEESDQNWQETLERYRVDNVLDIPEFQRYCLPFTPTELKEPAIVIPFSTDINFAKNFFGKDLAGGDNAYDSSHFSTKIRSAGVWFSGFDNTFESGMANQPRVYLIPVGLDYMRVPSAEMDEIRAFNVVDQALPVPYPLSENEWAEPDWSALKNTAGNELYDIRRYSALRAYHDSGEFTASEVANNSRLIGRSVWNSKWMLVIPAGTLLSDREEAMERFIYGHEVASGVRDGNGVKDIKIFFETYSNSGN
ncbi:LamG domain-containing protein [Pontiellaceae bacterium B12219]|nr:LamG domain-containing protein [Pontiellaceae bacterium B12219]